MSSTTGTSMPNLPGFNAPLNRGPEDRRGRRAHGKGFPNALDIVNGYASRIDVKREIVMMQVMNTITDKPDWDKKAFNEEIIAKWREEIAGSGADISSKMMDYIIKELQWKAESFKETGRVTVFDAGVVKSDTAISKDLQQALKEAAAPFEDVPEDQKDYHPGSDQQVVDLVHPSLFPLIYGRTRILPDRTIDLNTCLRCLGQGELLPVPPEDQVSLPSNPWDTRETPGTYSRKFQWLPCDVDFTQEGGCRIVSYINNAHPVEHSALYKVVEKIITQAIPLWNQSLIFRQYGPRRIQFEGVEYDDGKGWRDEPEQESDEEDQQYYDRVDEWWRSRPIIQPEPEDFKPPVSNEDLVDIRELFAKEGLQVIVKMANIELTPEKPEYAGGNWHIEGQLNERICATAIYYYDSDNITESRLAFRQRCSEDPTEVGYEQGHHEFLQSVYGLSDDVSGWSYGDITQTLGSVVCREGRLLTFPNALQHWVAPFSLEDQTKPGHRKILALFLIDPHRRIISTANVPPQQEEWGKERRKLVDNLLSHNLPPELQLMVEKDLPSAFITMDEAKAYRLELMKERSVKGEVNNRAFEMGGFSLCEH